MEISLQRQLCGNCLHVHSAFGVCSECGCHAFVLHADEVARLHARTHSDREEFGDRMLLDGFDVESLRELADFYEESLMSHNPWGALTCCLFTISVGLCDNPQSPKHLYMFVVTPLRIPCDIWQAGPTPIDSLSAISSLALESSDWFSTFRAASGLDPNSPVVAWGFAVEGETQGQEVRFVTVVDVDDREYLVQRYRSGERSIVVGTPSDVRLARELLGSAPPIHEPLAVLARLTTQETEIRSFFADVATGSSDSVDL